MILRSVLPNCVLDISLYLGGGLPSRKSLEAETQRVDSLAQSLLTISNVTSQLQLADSSEQSQKLSELKVLINPLKKDVEQIPQSSLKTTADRVLEYTLKVIDRIEKGPEDLYDSLEERITRLEDSCHLDKNYGQKEWLWIQAMLLPDSLREETECIEEWGLKLNVIYEHQAKLRSQFVKMQVELISIVKEEIEPADLELRVSQLFKEISKSFVRMEQAIKNQEKGMDAFGKEYSQFQKIREEIFFKTNENGVEKA
jgi:hypothetical protein